MSRSGRDFHIKESPKSVPKAQKQAPGKKRVHGESETRKSNRASKGKGGISIDMNIVKHGSRARTPSGSSDDDECSEEEGRSLRTLCDVASRLNQRDSKKSSLKDKGKSTVISCPSRKGSAVVRIPTHVDTKNSSEDQPAENSDSSEDPGSEGTLQSAFLVFHS